MGILSWIKVGEVAAENDRNLNSYFFDTGISRELVDSERMYLMLGRKGAGKTAVYQHLINPSCTLFKENDLIVPLSMSSYSWNAHALLANREKAAGFEQKDSWRFVLAVESISAFCKRQEKIGKKLPKEIESAKNLLRQIFSLDDPSWLKIIGEKLYRLSNLRLPSINLDDSAVDIAGGEIGFNDLQTNPSLLKNLNSNIEGLTTSLEAAIKKNIEDVRIFLLFDRLDEGWVDASHKTCKEIISGLIHAADYYAKEFNGTIRPVIFLREDIFSSLEINDRNKHLEDFGKTLAWSQDSLEKLVLKRINFYAQNAGREAISRLDDLFDKAEMRSRNKPRNYILGRTFYRPRDVICFLKRTIETMQEEAQDYEEVLHLDKLRAQDVYSAEPGYSEWLYKELEDEWKVQKPELFENIALLQGIGYSIFSRSSFFEKIRGKNPSISNIEMREALKFMFDNSIIGLKKEDNKWRFKCQRPSQGFQDEDNYKVHPGLIRSLGLTESSESEDSGI